MIIFNWMDWCMASSLQRKLEIVNELGLHARCASVIAEIAAKAEGNVYLSANSQTADAKDILDMLMLAPFACKGKSIKIMVENIDDKHVLDELAALVEDGFGED